MGFQKQKIQEIAISAVIALWTGCCLFAGCSTTALNRDASRQDCLELTIRRIRQAPEKEYLYTLDEKSVPLNTIFDQCDQNWPECILFPKFYHWDHEIKWVVSTTARGPLKHKIRVYYNPWSICHPEKVDPGRTHGDVAEFYDEKDEFMGLAVYMGQGQYFSLPYPGYRRSEGVP